MTHYKKLVGEKCYLSPCSSDDAEKWAEWDNDLEVAIPLGDEAYQLIPFEKEQEMMNSAVKGPMHIFDIIALEQDVLIGRCLLCDVDPVDRKAMLGIVIGEKEYWSQGYGQEAIKLLLDYGFNLLNLNSVMLGTISFNERAINCYRKVGFKEIGRRRQARIIAGKKFDVVMMDILAEEFGSPYLSRILPA